MNFYANINLKKFIGAKITEMKDDMGNTIQCISIPLIPNNFYIGKNNNIYTSLVGKPCRPKYNPKDTHMVMPYYTKARKREMTNEERMSIPILGNGRITGIYQKTYNYNNAPEESMEPINGDNIGF